MRSLTSRCSPSSLLALALAAALAVAPRSLSADDRQLLRFDSQKPYLFIIFDTSGSMASLPGDTGPAAANGDDPASKFYSAKQVAYNVFSAAPDVQFGFGTFNQDNLRVNGKHWLYTAATGTTAALQAANFPVLWPVDGEQWVFGTFFPAGTTGTAACGTVITPGTLGSSLPGGGISVSSCQAQLDRFPKLQANDDNLNQLISDNVSSKSTVLYLLGQGNKIYKYTISRQANSPNLGDATFTAKIDVDTCTTPSCNGSGHFSANLSFNLVTAFLMNENVNGSSATIDNQTGTWNYSDVVQTWACGSKPFSGLGMEGNYDGTYTNPPLPTAAPQARQNDPFATGYDPYVTTGACAQLPTGNSSAACPQNLKYPTTIAPPIPGLGVSTAVLDSGDLLPLNWNDTNQTQLLQRLAPNQAFAAPDFTQADYFKDMPDPVTGALTLRDRGQIPLLAAGPTPLGAAVVDFRCWYMGQGPGSKCNNAGNYTTPWQTIAASQDNSWGCRKPYLIIITDGNDTCGGPNPCADTANLNSKAGVQTWVIAYGANCNSIGNPAHCMAQNGKGQLVCPSDPSSLQTTLQNILGQIREQSREFASAAVPSVQATVADKIYLSDFTPAQGTSAWEGHINAFLKPLPLDSNGKPNTALTCASLAANQQSGCFLWDAAVQLVTQVPGSPPLVGDGVNQRRIYYSTLTTAGSWSGSRQLLNPTTNQTAQPIRYDLWRGFEVAFQPDNPTPDQAAQTTVNNVINTTESKKTHTFTPTIGTPHTDTYILGDIFHSNPLIVGTPANTKYFAANLNGSGGNCTADASTNTDTGYRCFQQRHANRRKLLLVGANDGMVHGIEIGVPHSVTVSGANQVQFDNGTGNEVWAYMPRAVMPTVKSIATGTQQHWTVDGTVQAADVFIDPLHNGTPNASAREWRSVAIAGLREGPEVSGLNGYYALDVTQPDLLGTCGGVANLPMVGPSPGSCTALPSAPSPPPASNAIASCDGVTGTPPTACGRLPYPAPLWEFYDQAHNADGSTAVDSKNNPVLIDEDVNGFPDLGHTWSTPTIGRIQIADATGKAIDKFVAIFGGGLDRNTKALDSPAQGSWLYMVDIETGKAIYKRPLKGCAASGAAAVDTRQSGILDRIYIGTTSGHLYRVDLGLNSKGHLPQLQPVTVTGTDGKQYTEQRITIDPDNGALAAWSPREIFNANYNGSTLSSVVRSIYFRPSVIFDARLGLYALAFGTGDREDLWSQDGQAQRYYLFLDDTDLLATSALPLNESNFTSVAVTAANTTADLLENGALGHRGWFLPLDLVNTPVGNGVTQVAEEKTITDSFALLGINTFSTFEPQICFADSSGNCTTQNTGVCASTGTSRIFVTFTTNANTVLTSAGGTAVRFYDVSTFVTAPYTEQAQTKNPSPSTPPPAGTNADQLTPALSSVMSSLKQLFPRNCRFGNYRIDIKAISGDTGVIFIAPVPICIVEKNWKEF